MIKRLLLNILTLGFYGWSLVHPAERSTRFDDVPPQAPEWTPPVNDPYWRAYVRGMDDDD